MEKEKVMDLIDRQSVLDALWLKYCNRPLDSDRYLIKDIRDIINSLPSAQPNKEQIKTGQWEMFELITSVYYGKQYYFKQENGIVYSRASCKYMSVDDAIKEFLDVIGE